MCLFVSLLKENPGKHPFPEEDAGSPVKSSQGSHTQKTLQLEMRALVTKASSPILQMKLWPREPRAFSVVKGPGWVPGGRSSTLQDQHHPVPNRDPSASQLQPFPQMLVWQPHGAPPGSDLILVIPASLCSPALASSCSCWCGSWDFSVLFYFPGLPHLVSDSLCQLLSVKGARGAPVSGRDPHGHTAA